MSNAPDPNGVSGALSGAGYVLLPFRGDGNPGDPVAGFDDAGGVSLVVLADGDQGGVDVLVEGSPDGVTWSTINDFSGLTHAASPAIFHVDTPAAHLRATLTGTVTDLDVRAYPHAGPRNAALLDDNGAFTNVTKPLVAAATADDLLAALVALGLVVDDT